jgi:hypothetical protein
MSSFCFLALVHPLNHNFSNETTGWEKAIEALFNQELKKYISIKLAKLMSRLDHRLKYILFTT